MLGQFAEEMKEELYEEQLDQVAGGVSQAQAQNHVSGVRQEDMSGDMARLVSQLRQTILEVGTARRETNRKRANVMFKMAMQHKERAIQQMKQAW